MRLQMLSENEVVHSGALGPVLIARWHMTPTPKAILPRRGWIQKERENFQAFGLIIVVEESAGGSLPGHAFARESRSQLEIIQHQPAFAALIVEGTGVVRSLIRTFIRGQTRASKGAHQTRSFLSVDGAAGWIGAQLAPWDGPADTEIIDAAAAIKMRAASWTDQRLRSPAARDA